MLHILIVSTPHYTGSFAPSFPTTTNKFEDPNRFGMPNTFLNNGKDIFWSSFYQNPAVSQPRYPSTAYFPQTSPSGLYNTLLQQQLQQQQRDNFMRTLTTPAKQEVRGPSVWGQIPIPAIPSNFMSPGGPQNNHQWRQYFRRLQQVNDAQNSWAAQAAAAVIKPKQMFSTDQIFSGSSIPKYQQQFQQQQQFQRQPTPPIEYTKTMLNPTDPIQVQRYYKQIYPGFSKLTEQEKQRRVTMARYLLTPLKILRKDMQMADLRHMINANRSLDSLTKYYKKKPAILYDISNTIHQSSIDNARLLPTSLVKTPDKTYAPRLGVSGNLHLDPAKLLKNIKPKTDTEKTGGIKQHEFVPRLDDAGNLHLDRAKKIFYKSAHPMPISRTRALQIALQRAHASTNKRVNPRVLNKMMQQSAPNSRLNPASNMQTPLNEANPFNDQMTLTGLPVIRQKPSQTNVQRKIATNIPQQNSFLPVMTSDKKVNEIFTAPALIRGKPGHVMNTNPHLTPPQADFPIIRLLMPTSHDYNVNNKNKGNAATPGLYESLNSLFKPSSPITLQTENTGVPLLRTKISPLEKQQLTVNNQLTGVPLIRAKPKVKAGSNLYNDDEPSLGYPRPQITQHPTLSQLAIKTEPPLQNIDPVHGNTALKIKTLRNEKTGNGDPDLNILLNLLNQQKPAEEYTRLLKDALLGGNQGNTKSKVENNAAATKTSPETPMAFRIFDKTKSAHPSTLMGTEKGVLKHHTPTTISLAERKKTAVQLSLVEDFLRTKISDSVGKRPSFMKGAHDTPTVESEQFQSTPLAPQAEHISTPFIEQPGAVELSNFFKEKELESHEIEKVDKPIYKRRKPQQPNNIHNTHTEFLLKTISPDPLPWDKRAKVTFKLSKKSDIPGKPQRVLGMYGSLKKKKKKKKKKKRMSEEEVEFDSSLIKNYTPEYHNSTNRNSKSKKLKTKRKTTNKKLVAKHSKSRS